MKKSLVLLSLVGLIGCGKQNFGVPDAADNFPQAVAYNNKVDIVLMIDNSTSMQTYQNQLSNQVPSFLSQLNSMGMSYHIAVVTSSVGTGWNGGSFVGSPKFVTNSTPNVTAVLQSRISAGQNGSILEQGLRSVQMALSPSYLNSEGAGFLRDDALLAVVFLSNEDDYSAGSVQSYFDHFESLKRPFPSGSRSWVANFIGVTNLDGNCNTHENGFKEVGLRYMDLVNRSGGRNETVCSTNLAVAASNVRVQISQILSDYYISYEPIVNTIQVTVSGRSIPQSNVNGWSYETKLGPSGQTLYYIRFHGTAIPNVQDSIRVNYARASAS